MTHVNDALRNFTKTDFKRQQLFSNLITSSMSNDRENFINFHDKTENHNSKILLTTEEREHNLKENNVF